jgi:hypothetical protein
MRKEGRTPYVLAAMFTAAYAEKAIRLAASCEKFAVDYELHLVPSVHRSISAKGSDDLAYTKPNFIAALLARRRKPLLYVDADCELMSEPVLIDQLVRSGCDFAVYNWFADEYTDGFVPIEISPPGHQAAIADRFYRFGVSRDWYSQTMLGCSGCVQFYAKSRAARAFLARWQNSIIEFLGCADDWALDFTFNNLAKLSWLRWLLKAQWLPKSYARIAWWIYVEPVINHADIPADNTGFTLIKDPKGRKVHYRSRAEHRRIKLLFPRDCIIDTQEHMICRLVDGRLTAVRPTNQRFWL